MSKPVEALQAHPLGEQSSVEFLPEAVGLYADTFGGRVHVEWDPTAAATPLGQLPFFVEFLKLGGLFDPWVADCPLTLISPNAPAKRDILGTLLLAVLAGHQRPRRGSTARPGATSILEAFGTGLVGVAGAARPRRVAAAGARRLPLGQRSEYEPGGTGGIAIPVQAAADPKRAAADRAGDGRAPAG